MRPWQLYRTVLTLSLLLFEATPTALAQQFGQGEIRELILQLDSNSDMILDRNEIPEAGRAAFERLLKRGDTNKDGRLDFEELRAMLGKLRILGGPAALAERLRTMDKDGDMRVSKEEFTGPAPAFERLDADKDGFLTRQDLEKLRPVALRFLSRSPKPPSPRLPEPTRPSPQDPRPDPRQ